VDVQQVEQEISIIKEMIDKTRKKTADSGHMLIYMGIFSIIATIAIGLMGMYQLDQYFMPAIIVMALVNAFIGYRIASKNGEQEKVKTYAKTLFLHVWMMCGFAAVLIVFLFPYLNLYPFHAAPVLTSLVMGIGVFITGSLFELKYVQWGGLVWWIGAVLIALLEGQFTIVIMVANIIFGWIIPGFLLNKQYKSGV
jgi:hypothetical protein